MDFDIAPLSSLVVGLCYFSGEIPQQITAITGKRIQASLLIARRQRHFGNLGLCYRRKPINFKIETTSSFTISIC